MEQYTGNGGNGDDYTPQPADAPQMVPQAPHQEGKKKRIWPWIVGGAVLIAAVALALVLWVLPSDVEDVSEGVRPFVFTEDGDAYLAAGEHAISLGETLTVYDSLDALISYDKKTFYYLTNVNSKGEGDLMSIALWAPDAEPECIAEDVFAAEISADGQSIIYLTDVKSEIGDLYQCSPGGEPVLIRKSVSTWYFGISADGSCFFYLAIGSDLEPTLMVYSDGREEDVMELKYEMDLMSAYIDNDGRLLFDVWPTPFLETEESVYLYANGTTTDICDDASFSKTFGGRADQFLYRTRDDELICYVQGEETLITEQAAMVRYSETIPGEPYSMIEPHFIYCEGEDDEVTIYEQYFPGDPVEIGSTDRSLIVTKDLSSCAFERNGKLYLVQKTDEGWGDPVKVCTDAIEPEYFDPTNEPTGFTFDDAEQYLYYIEAEDEGDDSGQLCRISLATGKQETLLDDTYQFVLSYGLVYALTDNGRVYRISGTDDPERIAKGASHIYEAQSGVYVMLGDTELYYYTGDEEFLISEDAIRITLTNGITGWRD